MSENIVIKTLNLCKKYYTTDTFLHAVRVAEYAINNPISKFLISNNTISINEDDIYCFALCHDLFEDTECSVDEVCEATGCCNRFVESILKPLTKDDNTDYNFYIIELYKNKYQADTESHLMSYLIKLSDMKDHLMEKETLTNYLKNKYNDALPYLL